MRALFVAAGLVVACAVACPPASTNGARACNQDRDCFVGEVCGDGLCVPDDGALDAGDIVDGGVRDAGDADAGSDGGTCALGCDAGMGDAGVADAGPSECPTFVDNFDGTDPPLAAFDTGGCAFSIADGVFTADLPATVASCGVTGPTSDARTASLLAVFDDDVTEDGTQQFIQLGNAGAQTSFALLAFPNGEFAARRSTTTNDDVFGQFLGPPPHTLELDFSEGIGGVEHVSWVVDGVVARAGDFGDDLSAAFNSVEVETFATTANDPPPVRVDRFALFAKCP